MIQSMPKQLRTAAGGAARQKYEDKGYADAAASGSFRISECPYADGWQRDAWQAGAWRWMEEQRKLRDSKAGPTKSSQHAHKRKIGREVDEILAKGSSTLDDGRRRSLIHRLEMVESSLRTLAPRSKGRRDLNEERDELRRQVAGRSASLPRWNEKRGWHGGDRHTLYLFSWPRSDGVILSNVYPGDRIPEAADHRSVVRLATRAEAEAMFQDPLHSGWTVGD